MWRFLLAFNLFISSLGFSKDILEFYNEYFRLVKSGSIKNNIEYYKIYKRGKSYKTISVTSEEMDVTVDFKNGYLSIIDEGTGGGNYEIYMAMFKSVTEKVYILIYNRTTDGVGIDNSLLYCYEVENGNWRNVKNEIFPENFWKLFFKEDFYKKNKTKMDKFFSKNLHTFIYEIPRVGTDLIVELNQTLRYYLSEEEASFYAKIRENALEKIILYWDKEKGKFYPK
ncbi:MAG: hypothetical protein N2258_05950 [Brevinematales bacterium]|nr:hypothetical protein [Brevinematales bacterium]